MIAQAETYSLQGKYVEISEISESINEINGFFQDMLGGEIACESPEIALIPCLGMAMARGDLSSLLFLGSYLYQNNSDEY